MRIKYTSQFAMDQTRHTAIRPGVYVRITNAKSQQFGMLGQVIKTEHGIDACWITFYDDHSRTAFFYFTDLEAI